ncbi:MAG: recombination protein RmuC [Frankiales bacterium]|jgi:DNA recombination protein RmuC|nr:recombination protein RmuC [Frankiales bacterium]MCW2708547.1 recombination protein RmuC [Frankiales bacterium]
MLIVLALLVGAVLGWLTATVLQQRRPLTAEPVLHQLDRVQDQLRALEVDRARASAELREQVSTMALGSAKVEQETRALASALSKPQARGRWGELQLRRVVEHAGMLDRCDFTEQAVLDGGLRPDLVVNLAGGGCVVVDAKVSLAAYLESAETGEPQTRHARHLREHVDRLADKAYWNALPQAPEFVVLFVPSEAMLAPALEADPALLEHAMVRRVHIATPTTLLSLLRAVAYAWQQHQLADNAQEVFAAGKDLFARLATFGAHVDKLGRSLSTAVSDFNKTVGSLERTVLPSARRMTELGLDGELPHPTPVEDVTRPVSAPHLIALPETG